jgi:hypothetical protein
MGVRTVREGAFRCHDNLVLPVGTRIAFPTLSIMQDIENFDNPHSFDGFRFLDEEIKSSGAASVSTKNLS